MFKRRSSVCWGEGLLVASLLVSLVAVSVTASAQAGCTIGVQLTALANDLGRVVHGECLEDPWTLDGEQPIAVTDQFSVTVPAGAVVQRTTTGVFLWLDATGTASFLDAWGEHSLTDGTFSDTPREQVAPAVVTDVPPTPTLTARGPRIFDDPSQMAAPPRRPTATPTPNVVYVPVPVPGLAPPRPASVGSSRRDKLESVTIVSARGDDVLIDHLGQRYLLELGAGCVSVAIFVGREAYVISPGLFAGIGSTFVLPDNMGSCPIWSSRRI